MLCLQKKEWKQTNKQTKTLEHYERVTSLLDLGASLEKVMVLYNVVIVNEILERENCIKFDFLSAISRIYVAGIPCTGRSLMKQRESRAEQSRGGR